MCEDKITVDDKNVKSVDGKDSSKLKDQIKGREHIQDKANIRTAERGNHDKRYMKRRYRENNNNHVTTKLYVSDVTTPVGKFFYLNCFFRTGRYHRKGKGHDEDVVYGCEGTLRKTEKMG